VRERLAVGDIVKPAEVLQGDRSKREPGGGRGTAVAALAVVVVVAIPIMLAAQRVHQELDDFLLKIRDIDFEQHTHQ